MKSFSTITPNNQIDSIAIGGFDGIHIAHQKLIAHLSENGALVVIDKNSATITPGYERCHYLEQTCIFLDFDEIKSMSAQSFVEALVEHFPKLQKIVVGYDFRFGKGASAGAEDLKRYFPKEVIIVDEVFLENTSVHSRFIRQEIRSGHIDKANQMLGREYSIVADVVKGQGIGAKELYATLNLKSDGFVIPKEGIYAGYTHIHDKAYPSAIFVGKRLTTDNAFSMETHLLDIVLDEQIDTVRVEFVDYVRENKKFESLKALKSQIAQDIETIKAMLV